MTLKETKKKKKKKRRSSEGSRLHRMCGKVQKKTLDTTKGTRDGPWATLMVQGWAVPLAKGIQTLMGYGRSTYLVD